MTFGTIEQAIEDIREGRLVIVADDENRENEGDLIGAAERVSPEMINFMATHGRGLICMPLMTDRCAALGLPQMTETNNESQATYGRLVTPPALSCSAISLAISRLGTTCPSTSIVPGGEAISTPP